MLPFNLGVTEQNMALMKGALDNRFNVAGSGLNQWNALQKSAVTTAGNIVGYDLQAPARLMLPIITPIRNSLPRRSRAANPGTQANWKTINASAFSDAGYTNEGWTNEGARAPQFTYSAANNSAAYQTIGTEDALTFEAESAAQGFEDANSLATFLLLQKMMVKEEIALLGGNNSVALGTPTTPTTSAAGSGATIPTDTYSVRVVALTVEGYNNSNLSSLVIPSQKQVTGPDGKVSTINGGASIRSAAASQAITLGENLRASTPVKNGAVAYAWFIGTGGTEYLQAITTINSVSLSSYTTSTQTSAAFTADFSVNDGTTGGGTNQVTAFNGLMTSAYAAGATSSAYVSALATGTAGTGTKLTSTTKGTVTEIDALLLYLWSTWRISPTKMWVNAQQMQDITTLCLNTSSAPLLRINSDGKNFGLEAGVNIEFYTNYFTMGGPVKMPVLLHPNVPPGTIFFQCEVLPSYFVNNQTPTVAEVLTRRDYYRIDWPLTTRERQYGVYAEEVLAVYAPFGFAILTNIAAGV